VEEWRGAQKYDERGRAKYDEREKEEKKKKTEQCMEERK